MTGDDWLLLLAGIAVGAAVLAVGGWFADSYDARLPRRSARQLRRMAVHRRQPSTGYRSTTHTDRRAAGARETLP